MATLYVTDLDGTLLASDGRLAEATAASLKELIARGVGFTYATARSHLSASRVTAGLGLRLPVAVYGGAMVVDAVTGAAVDESFIDADVTGAVLELCRAAGVPPLVFCRRDGRDRVVWVAGEESDGIRAFLDARGEDPRLAPAAAWSALPRRDVFHLSMIAERALVAPLTAAVADRFGERLHLNVQADTYPPHHTWLELTAPGVNKASAVLRLKQLAGADRLVVFGDNLNDLPMFAVADASYAVANAAPEVRAAATAVIPTNDENGVLHTLAALVAARG